MLDGVYNLAYNEDGGRMALFGKGFNIFKLLALIIGAAIVMLLIFKGSISEAIIN